MLRVCFGIHQLVKWCIDNVSYHMPSSVSQHSLITQPAMMMVQDKVCDKKNRQWG